MTTRREVITLQAGSFRRARIFSSSEYNCWSTNHATEAKQKRSKITLLRRARNRESFAQLRRLEPRDHLGRNRLRLQLRRIVLVACSPHARLAPFHGECPVAQEAMLYVEARAPEFADVREDFNRVAELDRHDEARPSIDQRDPHDAKGRRQVGWLDAERGLEQGPCADVEIFEEAAVEHDAGGIAVAPFDRDLPAIDESGHAVSV